MVKTNKSFLPVFSLAALLILVLVIGYWIFGETPTLAVFGVIATALGILTVLPSRFERIEHLIDKYISPEVHYTFIGLAVCLVLYILFYLSVNFKINLQVERKNNG